MDLGNNVEESLAWIENTSGSAEKLLLQKHLLTNQNKTSTIL